MNVFYNVDFANIVERALPPYFRKPKIMALLMTLLKPLIQRYNAPSVLHPIRYPNCLPLAEPSFIALGRHILARMGINGQVRNLERLLNWYYFQHFDVGLGHGNIGYWIWIDDYEGNIEIPFLFQKIENKVIYLYQDSENQPLYLYQESEYIGLIDFVVHVPAWLSHIDTEMKGLIDKYKIIGTRYKIVYY